jgi:heme exporter protein A
VRALVGITLTLAPGEFCLVTGPNGAGKSTLLRILSTLLRPTVGTVRYAGRTADEAGPSLRTRLAYLSHRTQLHGDLTGREDLDLAADLRGVPRDVRRRWTERIGLDGWADRPVRTYSRGQAQRLALARALLGAPDLVLLDEPATGLDPDGVAALRLLLAEQSARGTTVVVATHDGGAFAGLAGRTVRLAGGSLAAASTLPGGTP